MASDEHTAYNPDISNLLTGDMLQEMNIPENNKPFEQGINSVVFGNNRGNIVVFTFRENAKNIAEKMKSTSDVLPEIFKIKEFELKEPFEKTEWTPGSSVVYAIEMQKLKPLNLEEQVLFNQLKMPESEGEDIISFLAETQGMNREDVNKLLTGKIMSRMKASVKDLMDRSKGIGVTHNDLHGQNVGWDDSGKLRFIDLDDVDLEEVDLAPQSDWPPWPSVA